jgi:hypothetical protein
MADIKGIPCEPYVVKAVRTFSGKVEQKELGFKKDQEIVVSEKSPDGSTLFGEIKGTKMRGWFPAFYVKVVANAKPPATRVFIICYLHHRYIHVCPLFAD